MKRKIFALLLALCMTFQMAAVYAYDETNNDETMVPVSNVRTIDNTGNDEISNDEDDVVDNEIGDVTNVNFELQLRLDFKISLEQLEELKDMFKVCLQGTDVNTDETAAQTTSHPEYSTRHVHAYISSYNEDLIVFKAENVEPGEYQLTLETSYFFQDFSQKVTIKEDTKTTLVFSDSYNTIYSDNIGIYALGDINADGLINEEDSKILIEHNGHKKIDNVEINNQDEDESETISDDKNGPDLPDIDGPIDQGGEQEHSFEAIYDLNQDGVIDVADLAILVCNMDQEVKEATPIETLLPSAVKVASVQEAAIPTGDRKLDTIMEDVQELISLAPKNAENISEENPVKIEMDLSSSQMQTGGIVITAPVESGPTAGTIEVEKIIKAAGDGESEETEMVMIPIIDENTSRRSATTATAVRKADGSIVIDLKEQIAIKKVTIVVTATATNTNLTEIAKVEFLNDMESRIQNQN